MLAVLTGCASVPMGSDAEDLAAKGFMPRQGKANIYVYRHETMGAAVKMPVSLNGRIAGLTASKTYFLFEVDPGSHRLASHTENVAELTVNASAGRNYYVWQEVKMGLMQARSNLQLMDETAGRAGVMECKRAQASF
ncbi:MAG TPA: DUF2846 domain-containing protein [Burkholderiales bacterium]|nr:DUF2846 domain-containing protein [Burkholderiales bacterium]